MNITICPKRQSVLDEAGHCMVTGGPGSGKTTLALLKAAKRIDNGLNPGQQVLFLSFSRAAVARIADAAKQQVSYEKQTALSIQTFHSFFWQILQGYSYLLGLPRQVKILLAHDEKAFSNGIDRNSPLWSKWDKTRNKMAYEQGLICFDLFAPLVSSLFKRSNSICSRIARRYPLILVDEAQDTNDQQWDIIRSLSHYSQIVCFADKDQMIYDFLPGVGPARVSQIQEILSPLIVSLGSENNRSPSTEITTFARDIFVNKIGSGSYKGVSRLHFGPSADQRDNAIRKSIPILIKKIIAETGKKPESIALIASYSRGVAVISSALQLEKAIPHRVLFDEAFTVLSSRAAAFLLEPKGQQSVEEDTATLLEIIGLAFRAKGKSSSLKKGTKCVLYAGRCRDEKIPNYKVALAAKSLVLKAQQRPLTGDPGRDWLTVKNEMKQTGESSFDEIAKTLDYLVAFSRGRHIREGLSETWMQHSAYVGAREIINMALTQEQLYSDTEESKGIYVMNTHKCKGKQFDGIILYRQQYHSPFVWYGELSPYPFSRRLLHMAITRAKYHVLILEEVFSQCPICAPYKL